MALTHTRAPAPVLDTGLPLGQRCLLLGAVYVLYGWFLWAVVGRQRAGWRRLVLALPVLASGFVAPLLFDIQEDVMARTSTLFVISWLATFKVRRGSWRAYLEGCADRVRAQQALLAMTSQGEGPAPPQRH